MRLIDATIRPGKVLEVIAKDESKSDEENAKFAGAIKASAPGLLPYDPDDETSKDLLPPVYPWPFGQHANTYSCPKVDDEVWILSNNDNPLQLHWVRKDKFQIEGLELPFNDEAQNLEILLNREFEDSKWAILYFDNDDGWMMKKDEDGLINIRQDGSILLKTNFDKRIIDICEDSIALGTEGQAGDNAMLFSKWKEWLQQDLCDNFLTSLMNLFNANPYTAPAGAGMSTLINTLRNTGDPIKSDHVSIVEN